MRIRIAIVVGLLICVRVFSLDLGRVTPISQAMYHLNPTGEVTLNRPFDLREGYLVLEAISIDEQTILLEFANFSVSGSAGYVYSGTDSTTYSEISCPDLFHDRSVILEFIMVKHLANGQSYVDISFARLNWPSEGHESRYFTLYWVGDG